MTADTFFNEAVQAKRILNKGFEHNERYIVSALMLYINHIKNTGKGEDYRILEKWANISESGSAEAIKEMLKLSAEKEGFASDYIKKYSKLITGSSETIANLMRHYDSIPQLKKGDKYAYSKILQELYVILLVNRRVSGIFKPDSYLMEFMAGIMNIEEGNSVIFPVMDNAILASYIAETRNNISIASRQAGSYSDLTVWLTAFFRGHAVRIDIAEKGIQEPVMEEYMKHDRIIFESAADDGRSYVKNMLLLLQSAVMRKSAPESNTGFAKNGKLMIGMPFSYLTLGNEFYDLRKYLVEHDLLKAVIHMKTSPLFRGVNPGDSVVIIADINKGQKMKDRVFFAVAEARQTYLMDMLYDEEKSENELTQFTHNDEISRNDYNLNTELYIEKDKPEYDSVNNLVDKLMVKQKEVNTAIENLKKNI